MTTPDSSYDWRRNGAHVSGFSGIGLVLTKYDPYAIIDLDDCKGNAEFIENQTRIYQAFDSYSELSPSRKGLHIVIRAAIGPGRRRNKVELYSQERYMTFTGDVYGPNREIMDRQPLAEQLWHEMGKNGADVMYDGNAPQRMDDAAVIDMACRASNGKKFFALHTGRWQGIYQSQSEADFAYVDILAFYTQNREQLHRMFLASPLGQRDKAQRLAYRDYMINKSFDRMLPPINFDTITNAIREHIEAKQAAMDAGVGAVAGSKALDELPSEIAPPPGLLGDIARFVFAAAPRPVPEIALAGAIGFLAGITGRAYNVSATGLNQYVLLLAQTGRGKEAISSGISRIVAALTDPTPGNPYLAPTFRAWIGPSDMASGQGLLKSIGTRSPPSYVSIIGEFGLRFKQMSDERANPGDQSLLRAMLDLYNKSGAGQRLGETVYSKADDTTKAITAPALSIIGESVPQSFYAFLNEGMIANGLLPRFTIIEYGGPRPRRNPAAEFAKPDPTLLDRLVRLSTICHAANTTNTPINVGMTPDAEAYLNAFDDAADEAINTTGSAVVGELWNRAHVKALKLAALVAVGCDLYSPTITIDHAVWAREQVERDIRRLLTKFESGQVGLIERVTDHDKQTAYVYNRIMRWTTCPFNELPKGSPPYRAEIHAEHIVPISYLQASCLRTAAFNNDRDATAALRRALRNLVDAGAIARMDPRYMDERFNSRAECYVLTPHSPINDHH